MKKVCPKCNQEWEGYHDESASNHFCKESHLRNEIRIAVTYACTYVWEQTLKDMSAKGTLDRAIFPCVDKILTAISTETGRSF